MLKCTLCYTLYHTSFRSACRQAGVAIAAPAICFEPGCIRFIPVYCVRFVLTILKEGAQILVQCVARVLRGFPLAIFNEAAGSKCFP